MSLEWLPLLALGAVGLAVVIALVGHLTLHLLRLRSRSSFAVGLAGASVPALLTGLAACPLFTLPFLALLGMGGARILRRMARGVSSPRRQGAAEVPAGAMSRSRTTPGPSS